MKTKILLLLVLFSANNLCFAYNDYGYSYGVSTPYSGGFDSSMHLREMQNDFDRTQALNAANNAAYASRLNQPAPRLPQQECISQPLVNPNRSYVIDKPLSLKGIYPYDAYGK